MNKNMREIERKFLVKKFPKALPEVYDTSYELVQGYLVKNDKGTVRIRIEAELNGDTKAYLMSKTKVNDMTNDETVDEITLQNAWRLIDNFSINVIKKTRFVTHVAGKKWEIDVFKQPLGLILAEIELESADEKFELPEWIDREVTGESQYYNANM